MTTLTYLVLADATPDTQCSTPALARAHAADLKAAGFSRQIIEVTLDHVDDLSDEIVAWQVNYPHAISIGAVTLKKLGERAGAFHVKTIDPRP